MNNFSKNSVGSGLNVFKTGGSNSFMQKIFYLITWKTAIIFIFALLIILFSYYIYKKYSKKQTFYANRENIPKELNSNKNATLMLFYVDWCPHCKTAKPEWESLKEEYDGKSINGYIVNFTEYNCTEESSDISELINKYEIEGYPTIKLIKDNQVIEYDAKLTKSTMEQFLQTVL